MKPVLFASSRPLDRAENIKAVFDAYKGEKEFVKLNPYRDNNELQDGRFKVLVTDEFVNRSPEICIMIGHGMPGGKTYGLNQPFPYHSERAAKLITFVVTSSKYFVDVVAKESGVNVERVLPLGMPRTDAYFRTERQQSKYRTYLYAPTYRGAYEGLDPMKSTDFREISDLLNDDERLIVKAHMMDDDPRINYKRIIVESNTEPSTNALINCDVLITDYSSIMFDAYLLNKPVVLFAKDRGTYSWFRGMYLKYPEEYSGRFCDNETDLVKLIREATEPTEAEVRAKQIITGCCDGYSAERVANLVAKLNESEAE